MKAIWFSKKDEIEKQKYVKLASKVADEFFPKQRRLNQSQISAT